METEELVIKIAEAFDRNDSEGILALMSDDIAWTIVGHETISGKDNMRKSFENPGMKILSTTKENIVINGNKGVISGLGKCQSTDGKILELFYCDIYETSDGKISKMTSYCVDKKG